MYECELKSDASESFRFFCDIHTIVLGHLVRKKSVLPFIGNFGHAFHRLWYKLSSPFWSHLFVRSAIYVRLSFSFFFQILFCFLFFSFGRYSGIAIRLFIIFVFLPVSILFIFCHFFFFFHFQNLILPSFEGKSYFIGFSVVVVLFSSESTLNGCIHIRMKRLIRLPQEHRPFVALC